jgi:gluconokinase
VLLDGDKQLILERMASRDHFMPSSLLDSQLDTLEHLEDDERGIEVDIDQPLDQLVDGLVERLSR